MWPCLRRPISIYRDKCWAPLALECFRLIDLIWYAQLRSYRLLKVGNSCLYIYIDCFKLLSLFKFLFLLVINIACFKAHIFKVIFLSLFLQNRFSYKAPSMEILRVKLMQALTQTLMFFCATYLVQLSLCNHVSKTVLQ